jgi:hypothetical protein
MARRILVMAARLSSTFDCNPLQRPSPNYCFGSFAFTSAMADWNLLQLSTCCARL